MKNERLEAYQVKKLLKKLENPLGEMLGVSERGLGGEKIVRMHGKCMNM